MKPERARPADIAAAHRVLAALGGRPATRPRETCGNGIGPDPRAPVYCREPVSADPRNPLRFCARCLERYRAACVAPTTSANAGAMGRFLFFDKATGKMVALAQPPGGVPVAGRDFFCGPEQGDASVSGLCDHGLKINCGTYRTEE